MTERPKKAKVVIIIVINVIIIIIICNFGIIVAALVDDIAGCRPLGAHNLRQTRRDEGERARLLTTLTIAIGIGSTSTSVPSTVPVTVPVTAPVDLSVCHDAPKKRKVEFEFDCDCDCDLELESQSKLESESESESESDTMLSRAKRFARRNSSVRLSNTYSNGPSNAYQ